MPIVDFLQTKRGKDELRIALEILQEFKEGENWEEWLAIPFAAWAKLEQLEEYLEFLVNDKPLQTDTLKQLEGG